MMFTRFLGGLLVAVIVLTAAESWAQGRGGPPKRSITKIAGDVYRFQNNFHTSVFMVTRAGIIATDPINKAAATWLKGELIKRFSQPVKYVILSHDHADHISGGEVFAGTAITVSHANARADIVAERRPTKIPDVTFTDRMTLELGGKRVELSHVGRNHSDGMIVMRFPAERVLFAVDFIPVKALAFKDLRDAYIDDWITSLKRVEAMDFDILAPGHGRMGKKADVAAFRGYMEDLRGAVLAGLRTGMSLAAMQKTIKLAKYKEWGAYGRFLPFNIKGMYDHMRLQRR
jgi:glyoxylase-like metal-dependent hydrolase (beta-lactamase superfamily II)